MSRRIGIDARFYGKAGPGRYTKNIVQHLEKVDTQNEYLIFLTKEGYDMYTPKNANFHKVLADYHWYSFEEQFGFLWLLLKSKLDLYYVPHFNIPVLYPGKIITAIPDMTMHKFSTEKGTTLPIWYFRLKKYVYKAVFWWAVFRSQKVIVPSQTVLNDFLSNLNFSNDKYVLVLEGVDPDLLHIDVDVEKVLAKYRVTKPFILYVSSMYEHKNVPGLIEMFKLLVEKYGYKGNFVLVSKKDKFSQRVYQQIKAMGYQDKILFPAFRVDSDQDIVVSDSEVVAFRRSADLYVFASFTEGFSLTALEGMVEGLPAVLSDIDCHREIYEDSVLYCDPHNPSDIAEKVNTMLTDKSLFDEYKKRGYEQIKKYDWLKTAEITLDVFKSSLEI